MGPNEEPEILLMLRKSQELQFAPLTFESSLLTDKKDYCQNNTSISLDSDLIDESNCNINDSNKTIQNNKKDSVLKLVDQSWDNQVKTNCYKPDVILPTTIKKNRLSDIQSSVDSETYSYVSDVTLPTSLKQNDTSNKRRSSKNLLERGVHRILKRHRKHKSNKNIVNNNNLESTTSRIHEDAQSLPDRFSRQLSVQINEAADIVVHKSNNEIHIKNNNHHCNSEGSATNSISSPLKQRIGNKGGGVVVPRFPIMKKIQKMANRQKNRLHIKRIHLRKDERIEFNEQTKILKLRDSPKSQRSDIPHFIEKQDSDDVLEIVELDESPSRKRKDDYRHHRDYDEKATGTTTAESTFVSKELPPLRPKRRDHIYEEISNGNSHKLNARTDDGFHFILDATSVQAIKQSLNTQDNSAMNEVMTAVNTTANGIRLDRMGSSEEDQASLPDTCPNIVGGRSASKSNLLAPLSSIDSTSSDEDNRNRKQLQTLIEEETTSDQEQQSTVFEVQLLATNLSFKKELSPAPSEKKVTFTYIEDEAEPHREDIELSPEAVIEAQKRKTKSM